MVPGFVVHWCEKTVDWEWTGQTDKSTDTAHKLEDHLFSSTHSSLASRFHCYLKNWKTDTLTISIRPSLVFVPDWLRMISPHDPCFFAFRASVVESVASGRSSRKVLSPSFLPNTYRTSWRLHTVLHTSLALREPWVDMRCKAHRFSWCNDRRVEVDYNL